MNLIWRSFIRDLYWLLEDVDRKGMPNRALITLPGYDLQSFPRNPNLINAYLWSDSQIDWVHDPDAPTELEECQAYMAMRVRMGDTP